MNILLKSLILVLSGIILLRISGRKSISQMTLAQTVVMISIGAIIIQPIVDKGITNTLIASVIFVATLLILEWLQLKFNSVEKFITGKSKVVIKDGQLQKDTLKKLRLTVDQLEIRIRSKGIEKISDIKTATIEPNGQMGYELMDDAKPLTVGEFKKLISPMMLNAQNTNQTSQSQKKPSAPSSNVFDELNNGIESEHKKYLQ